jgi:D-glycero-alpha-D-manno-heptose-7-phosphate kinase
MIITRSPLRISLGGGGTDLPSYYREHEGFLVAAAIDKYVFINVHRRFADGYLLNTRSSRKRRRSMRSAPDHSGSAEADAHRGASARDHQHGGHSRGTGSFLGSFTTALLKALYALRKDLVFIPAQLAEQACEIELEKLREPIGKPDQYIAAFGGLTCFRFLRDGRSKPAAQDFRRDALQSRGQLSCSSLATRDLRPRYPEGAG